MTKPIMIKTLSLGDGQPKICVPLTGGTAEELFQEAEKIKEAGADLAEWRADFYENLSDTDRVVKTMGGIAGILSGIPLLFTIRTEKEGGKAGISPEFFIEITMEIYGPLLFLLLILAGLTGKRGKIIKTGLLTLALLGMSGCGISLEDRVFPMSMGVDYENGHYRIVYGIPQLSKVTGQDKEETQSGEEQALAYEGLTPQDALERFNENQENYLDMGHMKAIILGEHIMENRDALAGFLGFLEDNPAVAGNIYVFVTEDMEALMSLDGQGVDSVGDYLTGILENTMDKKEQKAVILQDLYGAWHREEEFPKLPEVTIVNKKPSIRQHSG